MNILRAVDKIIERCTIVALVVSVFLMLFLTLPRHRSQVVGDAPSVARPPL